LTHTRTMGGKGRGNLVIIGGAEDKQGKCTILRTVSLLAGGRQGTLARARVVLEEPEAVRAALRNAGRGDLVVVFYEKYDGVMAAVREGLGLEADSPPPRVALGRQGG